MSIINDLFIKTERHHLILDEEDVIRVLQVINDEHRVVPNMRVGNCGWTDTRKWFIHFDTTRRKWQSIVHKLNVVRVFGNCDIPEHTIGIVYTDD